jgi:drug/metabolite transporter (DMT)-like permease
MIDENYDFDYSKKSIVEPINYRESTLSSAYNHLLEIEGETPSKTKSELHSTLLFALSMIVTGINHFHFKYMKKSIGLQNYNEFSFVLIRCIFIIGINYIKMLYNKETINPFSKLKNNIWFWIRNLVQFFSVIPMLYLVSFFRVSTASCFVSMSPAVIIIMSCVILKEKFYWRYVIGIIICFSGVILIVSNDYQKEDSSNKKSGILYLIEGFFLGCFQLMNVALLRVSSKVLVKEKINNNAQLIYPSLTCIILSSFSFFILDVEFKYGKWLIFHSFLNSIIWLVSTILMLLSFGGVDLIKTTALNYLNIVTVFFLGVLILGESVHFTDILGSLIILGYNIYNTAFPPS